jgi:hypothetical protein
LVIFFLHRIFKNSLKRGGEMTQITEIGLDLFKISTFIKEANLTFNQFLVRDEEPLTSKTEKILERLADLNPKTIAAMHGSTYRGDGRSAIHDLMHAMKDVLN